MGKLRSIRKRARPATVAGLVIAATFGAGALVGVLYQHERGRSDGAPVQVAAPAPARPMVPPAVPR
ncbi:hypothetical protein, partial [Skermanella stibiiresistens]|uniref:hypothetical protein n=1 Tax=Skermanella stibiiresistens TaxID=913326 RepID=UPI000559BD17